MKVGQVHKRTAIFLIALKYRESGTISYGGITAMYCTQISEGYTMKVPLGILDGLAADFDRNYLLSIYRAIYICQVVNCWEAKPYLYNEAC